MHVTFPILIGINNSYDNNTQILMSISDDNIYNITCKDDFYLSNNTVCLPRCDRFEGQSHDATLAIIAAEIIAASIAVVFSIVALCLSVYNRINM